MLLHRICRNRIHVNNVSDHAGLKISEVIDRLATASGFFSCATSAILHLYFQSHLTITGHSTSY